jgi:hypothetical protein
MPHGDLRSARRSRNRRRFHDRRARHLPRAMGLGDVKLRLRRARALPSAMFCC